MGIFWRCVHFLVWFNAMFLHQQTWPKTLSIHFEQQWKASRCCLQPYLRRIFAPILIRSHEWSRRQSGLLHAIQRMGWFDRSFVPVWLCAGCFLKLLMQINNWNKCNIASKTTTTFMYIEGRSLPTARAHRVFCTHIIHSQQHLSNNTPCGFGQFSIANSVDVTHIIRDTELTTNRLYSRTPVPGGP